MRGEGEGGRQRVRPGGEVRTEGKRARTELALQVREHRVGVGGRDGDGHPGQDAQEELARLGAHEGRDDRAVERGDVEREEGAHDEEKRVQDEEGRLLGAKGGEDDAEEARQPLEEECVDLLGEEEVRCGVRARAQRNGRRTSTRGPLFFLPRTPALALALAVSTALDAPFSPTWPSSLLLDVAALLDLRLALDEPVSPA